MSTVSKKTSAVQEKNTSVNSISQEAKPQPSQSSCLNRCLQMYWGAGTRDADYFIHRCGGGKPSKYLTVVLCMTKNTSWSISAECSSEFTTRKTVLHGGQSKVTEDVNVLLLGGHKNHPEKNHSQLIQTPNAGLHRHSTGSPLAQQVKTFVFLPSFHLQRWRYLAAAHPAYDRLASGPPTWFSFRYLPPLQNQCTAEHHKLIHDSL